MANLVELSNQLEYVPQEQLVQMSQDPNSMFPSFLVLSEIQRRNQMKKMYEAQQPKPQTTVAEEVVQEFAGQQGLQGAMAQSPGPQNAFQPGDMGNMAPPSPMQGMAAGGRTGYQTGGSLGLSGDSLAGTFTNPTQDIQTENEPGFFSKAINWAKENPADALSMAANATFFIPGVGVVAGSAIKGGIKLLPKVVEAAKKVAPVVKKGLQKTYTKPNPALEGGLKAGQRKVLDPKTKKYEMIDTTTGKAIPERIFSGERTALAALPLTGTTKVLTELALSPDEEIIEEQANINKPEQVDDTIISARKTVSEDVETGRKGLGNFLPNADPSMLIGLGGAIMSAKNVGELGKGISDMYLGERARKDALQMADLKSRLTEAQIRKYEADVSNMDANQIIAEMNAINKGVESGAITIDDELQAYVSSLRARLQALREKTGTGFAASETPTLGEFLDNREIA